MERTDIKDFKAGSKVKTILLIKSLDLMSYKDRNGQYLSITFQDRTGEISCKLWDNFSNITDKCTAGTVVQVEGNIYDYKGLLQLQLDKIRIEHNVDSSWFLPVSPRDIGQMKTELLQMIETVDDIWLQRVLRSFFDNQEILDQYLKAPAAKQNHQAYLGGLLEHSLNVARLALSYGEILGEYNRDLLLTGALLHDIGKIKELCYDTTIDYTLLGRLHGHIFIGAHMVSEHIAQIADFPEELAIKLVHMLLSHHGEYEYGSPKRPKFLEAQLLFRADMVDFEACKFREIRDDEEITFNKTLQRFIIK